MELYRTNNQNQTKLDGAIEFARCYFDGQIRVVDRWSDNAHFCLVDGTIWYRIDPSPGYSGWSIYRTDRTVD